uniref:Uncharacterized protein n=1 Tax=Tetranychus urticae TaxID=32264 RepID=T1KS94_TETUR
MKINYFDNCFDRSFISSGLPCLPS